MVEIHAPPNEAPITELYAVLSTDEHGDGICAVMLGGVAMPLVVSQERLVPLRNYAARVAKRTNRKLKLVKFTAREELESIEP